MMLQASEITALHPATRCCWQHCTVWAIPGASAILRCDGSGRDELREANLCMYGFVLLPLIAAARPLLLDLCIPHITGISCSVSCCSGGNVSASPDLRAADAVLCNPTSTATTSAEGSCKRKVRQGSEALWLCLAPGNGSCLSTAAPPVFCLWHYWV